MMVVVMVMCVCNGDKNIKCMEGIGGDGGE